jgi:hypothetical protein
MIRWPQYEPNNNRENFANSKSAVGLAYEALARKKHLAIVPSAMDLFEEPAALQEAACLAAHWFRRYLRPNRQAQTGAPRNSDQRTVEH